MKISKTGFALAAILFLALAGALGYFYSQATVEKQVVYGITADTPLMLLSGDGRPTQGSYFSMQDIFNRVFELGSQSLSTVPGNFSDTFSFSGTAPITVSGANVTSALSTINALVVEGSNATPPSGHASRSRVTSFSATGTTDQNATGITTLAVAQINTSDNKFVEVAGTSALQPWMLYRFKLSGERSNMQYVNFTFEGTAVNTTPVQRYIADAPSVVSGNAERINCSNTSALLGGSTSFFVTITGTLYDGSTGIASAELPAASIAAGSNMVSSTMFFRNVTNVLASTAQNVTCFTNPSTANNTINTTITVNAELTTIDLDAGSNNPNSAGPEQVNVSGYVVGDGYFVTVWGVVNGTITNASIANVSDHEGNPDGLTPLFFTKVLNVTFNPSNASSSGRDNFTVRWASRTGSVQVASVNTSYVNSSLATLYLYGYNRTSAEWTTAGAANFNRSNINNVSYVNITDPTNYVASGSNEVLFAVVAVHPSTVISTDLAKVIAVYSGNEINKTVYVGAGAGDTDANNHIVIYGKLTSGAYLAERFALGANPDARRLSVNQWSTIYNILVLNTTHNGTIDVYAADNSTLLGFVPSTTMYFNASFDLDGTTNNSIPLLNSTSDLVPTMQWSSGIVWANCSDFVNVVPLLGYQSSQDGLSWSSTTSLGTCDNTYVRFAINSPNDTSGYLRLTYNYWNGTDCGVQCKPDTNVLFGTVKAGYAGKG